MDEREDKKRLIIFLIIIGGLFLIMLISSFYTNSKIEEIIQYDNSFLVITQLKKALATLWVTAFVSILVDIFLIFKRNLFSIVIKFENETYKVVCFIVLIFFNLLIWYNAISPFITYRDLVIKAVLGMFNITQ